MDNEIIKLLTIIAIPTITIVGSNIVLFMNLNKKVDNLNDRITKLELEITKEITNLKIETKTSISNLEIKMINEITNLKIEIENLNSKFDRLEERNTATNQRLDAHIVSNNQRINKLETDFKDVTKELISKMVFETNGENVVKEIEEEITA